MSPGINFKKAKLKTQLIRNKHKIITDLDLFYLLNPKVNSIIITGTNGKSTTCKILEHVFKKNKGSVEQLPASRKVHRGGQCRLLEHV